MKRISVILTAMLVAFLMGGSWAWAGEDQTSDDNCVTETTGWVLESPGKGWTLVDERTVVDKEAWEEVVVVTKAQHYSLKGNSGIGKDEVPVFPADYWQANTKKEPHYQGNATPAQKPDGTPYVDGESGLHYTSNESSGKRDWFYFQPEVTEIVEHPAVTHQEYKFSKTVCIPPNEYNAGAAVYADCGNARVELWFKYGEPTDPPTFSKEFAIYVDGVLDRTETLRQDEDIWFPYNFAEDSGRHIITVTYDGSTVLAETYVWSDCQPDRPDQPKPDEPKDHEPKPDKPQKPVAELPHTGGNLALAGIAAALLAAGSGMVWFGRCRLTDQ